MGMIYKARGNPSFGLLIIRLTLGGLFLVSGAVKLANLEAFVTHVKAMNVVPENLAFIMGFMLPFAEVFLGAMFIIGFFTPIVSFLLSLINIGLIITLGPGDPVLPFSYHFVFLACTLTTLFTGAGVISFDALLDRDKKREVTVISSGNNNNVVREEVREIKVEPVEVKDTIYPNEEDRKDL